MDNINYEGLLRDNKIEKPVRCSKCGGFLKYDGLGEYACEKCGYHEYDDYGKVRAYLEANPGANVVEVSDATGVSQKLIHQMVSEGKFEVTSKLGYLKGGSEV